MSGNDFPQMTLEELLREQPPPAVARISEGVTATYVAQGQLQIAIPRIRFRCNVCDGERNFDAATKSLLGNPGHYIGNFLEFTCGDCLEETLEFAVRYSLFSDSGTCWAHVAKVGQLPQFGPHTPSRLMTLIGPHRDAFLKGRRSESHGLGIGAFAYYRRVVEDGYSRLIEEISRAAKSLEAPQDTIEALEAASKEQQFKKAVAMAKEALPESLMIKGRNPLTLLHSALSAGLHNQSDEVCLKKATAIRLILTELAVRLSELLRERRELHEAVNHLVSSKTP